MKNLELAEEMKILQNVVKMLEKKKNPPKFEIAMEFFSLVLT